MPDILQLVALDHLRVPAKIIICFDCCDAHSTSEVGQSRVRRETGKG